MLSFINYSAGMWGEANVPASAPAITLLAAAMTARALHAHWLNTAAARRLRAVDRLGSQRGADAKFWLLAAPSALAKAAALRREARLASLP